MLVPLLMAYLLSRDEDIGMDTGKFVFYVGMFLALFGDVLLISINDTFFMSGMIAFMLMNFAYAIAFYYLEKASNPARSIMIPSILALTAIAVWFYYFLANDMGSYRIPVLAYMCTVLVMTIAAIAAATKPRFGKAALHYFVSGALVFLVENILIALNRFRWDSDKDVYVVIMFTYGLAQFLFVRGIEKTYLTRPPKLKNL